MGLVYFDLGSGSLDVGRRHGLGFLGFGVDGLVVFLGVLCEINEDDCAVIPGSRVPKCLNNGTCMDRVGGYGCSCPPGFTGERCEGDINECQANHCHPRNTLDCVQEASDYQCICKPGYTGE